MHMHFLPVINEQNSHKQLHTESYGRMNLQSLFIPRFISLSISPSHFLCLLAARQQYLLLGISFVLIIKDKWLVWLSECLI